jgi:hypothetical protein
MIRDHFISFPDLIQNGLILPPIIALHLGKSMYWGGAITIAACIASWFALRAWSKRSASKRKTLVLLGYASLVSLALAATAIIGLGALIRKGIGAERLTVLQAMDARPQDPWPRGVGHVPLGTLGSEAFDKAYVEPGGSFSPWVGSFGLSLWVIDEQGKLIATSDSIPLAQTQHSYVKNPAGQIGLQVSTNLYQLQWQIESDQVRTLRITSKLPKGQQLLLAIRGVGPAGGPLTRVQIDRQTISLNGRWRLTTPQVLEPVFLGIEGKPDWTLPAQAKSTDVRNDDGWAHARFRLPSDGTFAMTISDASRSPNTGFAFSPQAVVLEGIDPRFAKSLQSQIETLKQGVVGDEIRPGEPVNYPLPWLRDNAFQIVALARAGETDLARKLAKQLAEKDFFGGFGAEGDNPGLAIWSLHEVAILLKDPAFDKMLWPHIQRKVKLIIEELNAKENIYHDYDGPIVPFHTSRRDLKLTAGPAHDGLINGRMDLHHPIFFVSAADYAGLVAAADIARTLGHQQLATQWTEQSSALRTAWQKAFLQKLPGYDNERTSIFGLWPSEIAPVDAFQDLLQQSWDKERTRDGGFKKKPLWSYFAVADAHQWLRIGHPDRTWLTLEWLWANETTPGLFTLWEGDSEENSFRQWRDIRGWVNPPYVTPHYWSASELLLLQLGMLAEVQGAGADRKLIIGAGVQKDWLTTPIDVRGIGTEIGFVDWAWDGHAVIVRRDASKLGLPIQLGAAFSKNTPVTVVDH